MRKGELIISKDAKTLEKKPYQLYNLPWYYFGIFAAVVLAAACLGVLPTGMAGCFAFMIVLGTILNEIGDHTPTIRSCLGVFFGAAIVGKFVGFYPVESGLTAGLCMSNMGGTGDVAVLSAANRMELMPFAQISSRLGGAIILLLGSVMLSTMAHLL